MFRYFFIIRYKSAIYMLLSMAKVELSTQMHFYKTATAEVRYCHNVFLKVDTYFRASKT